MSENRLALQRLARPPQLTEEYLREQVREALLEDLGPERLDPTTQAVVGRGLEAHAELVAKGSGVVAGLIVVEEVFRQLDATVTVETMRSDASGVERGDVIALISGPLPSLLQGERTALNFLQQLSGVASLTRRYVYAAAACGPAVILDTRKTIPGLRPLQRYAVLAGGGHNHRYNLTSAVLIKDNHVKAAGGVAEALRRVRGAGLPVELEVDDLEQLQEAVREGVETILLDNFSTDQVAEAVRLVGGRVVLEVSGGVQLSNVAEYAATGVERISVGALTHSAPALDISLEVVDTWSV